MLLTLPGHGFYWFDITPASDKQGQRPSYSDDGFGRSEMSNSGAADA